MKSIKKTIKLMVSKVLLLLAGFNKNDLDNLKWINKYYSLYIILRKLIGMSLEKFSYYFSVVVEEIKGDERYIKLRDRIISEFEKKEEDKVIFMIHIMYFNNIFDSEVLRAVTAFARREKNIDILYWLTLDLAVMVFRYQDSIYPGFVKERKELMRNITYKIGFKNKRIINETKKNDPSRVCILSYCLDANPLNSSQRVTCMVANGLASVGYEVIIICIDSFVTSCDKESLYTINQLNPSYSYEKDIRNQLNNNVRLIFMKEKFYADRACEILKSIGNFNPNYIIDITDEFNILSSIISKNYCVFYLPLRSIPSCMEYYRMIPVKRNDDNTHFIDWSLPEYIPIRKKQFKKSDVKKLKVDTFVIVTIGNNDFYINDNLADLLCDYICKNESVVWILVGRPAPQYIRKKYKKMLTSNQIIEWGFEDDLVSLCSICDVMFRPDMLGGSGATAIAASCGLPIILTKKWCDPLRWLGEEYTTNISYEDCIIELDKMIKNKDYYRYKSILTRNRINKARNSKEKWTELGMKLMEAKKEYELEIRYEEK